MDENKTCNSFQTQQQNSPSKIFPSTLFNLNFSLKVNFTDNTEIVLSSENKIVTYMNKKGVRSVYPLQTALDNTNSEMVKRLKYTRELLTYMVNGGAPENKIEVDMKI